MDEKISKPSFLVYYDNEIVVSRLPDKEAGKLFKSLFSYGREEIKPDFDKSPALAIAFDILSMAIDRDKEKYVKRCEANRENGRKGGLAKASNSKQALPNGKQKLANLADKEREKDKERDMGRIDYQHIADMYNEICISFPRLTKLSDSRKKAIKARLNQYSIEDFRRLFELAEESSFLKGQNGRDWSANFDWLIKDANMAKVLDKNYADKDSGDNRGQREVNGAVESANQSRRTTRDFYEQYLGTGNGD